MRLKLAPGRRQPEVWVPAFLAVVLCAEAREAGRQA